MYKNYRGIKTAIAPESKVIHTLPMFSVSKLSASVSAEKIQMLSMTHNGDLLDNITRQRFCFTNQVIGLQCARGSL